MPLKDTQMFTKFNKGNRQHVKLQAAVTGRSSGAVLSPGDITPVGFKRPGKKIGLGEMGKLRQDKRKEAKKREARSLDGGSGNIGEKKTKQISFQVLG